MATYSSIKYTEISDNAITTNKIANEAVTVGKLVNTLDISSKTVTLPNNSVTNAMLAGSIDLTSKITGTIPTSNGGTGLTSLGTANQVLRVNSGATALEFATAGASWEYHYQTQDDIGNISSGAQAGNSLTFTPALSGVCVFSGCLSYRAASATYYYWKPRGGSGSTDLMEFGHAYATSNSGHNQGFSWSCDGGVLSSSTEYSFNIYNNGGGTANQSSDDGNQLHLICEVASNYTRS